MARPRRAYHSPMREARAVATRQRILDATREFLELHPVDGLTLPKVAELADVSAPTVYRSFATVDDLLEALLLWLWPQLALERPSPSENFPRYEANRVLIGNLLHTSVWTRMQTRDARQRASRRSDRLMEIAPALPPADRHAAAAAVHALGLPQMWHWMRHTWELQPEQAERAASWARSVLLRELETNPPRLDRGRGPQRLDTSGL